MEIDGKNKKKRHVERGETMDIKEFILEELEKECDIDKTGNLDGLNFVEEGYVTSIGIIQFVVRLEEQYGIEFTKEELASDDFKILGNLASMIERKIKEKQESKRAMT